MILHQITVENWRSLLGERVVGPFSEGINILHGPNATGKSTLFEALRRGLMDNHNVGGADIQKVRPWGRALSPSVTVEFTLGETRYRVKKSFLDRPQALLERFEEKGFKPLAEGPKADEMTRALFTREGVKKGLSRPEHWGIQQILWTPQGGLEMGELSGNLLDDIRSSITTQAVDDRTRAVAGLLQKRYESYFTPTGKEKSATDLARYKEEINKIKAELAERRADLKDAQVISNRVTTLSADVGTLSAEKALLEAETRALDEKTSAYKALREELERRSQEAKAKEGEYGRLKMTLDQINEGEREKEEAEKKAADNRALLDTLKGELKEAAGAMEEGIGALEAAREEGGKADEMVRQAVAAQKFGELREGLRLLTKKRAGAEGLKSSLRALEAERASAPFPDAREIRKIREAHGALERGRIEYDASRITLEITPERDLSVRVDSGRGGEVAMEAGKTAAFMGSPEVRLHLHSFGTIRAFGPTDSAEDALEALGEAKRFFEKLTAPFGAEDMKDLEELHDRGTSLSLHIEREESELRVILGQETLEGLIVRQSEAEREIERIFEEFPRWRDEAPKAEGLAAAAESAKREAAEKILAAEVAGDKAAQSFRQKETDLRLCEQSLKNEETILAAAGDRLQKLRSDGRTNEERSSELTSLALAWDGAKGRMGEAEEKLRAFGGDPSGEGDAKKKSLEAKARALQAAREEMIREKARLEIYSARGLYSAVAALEERLASLESLAKKEELAARSIRLLQDTFASCRSEMAEGVTERASELATEIFCQISGGRDGAVVLGPSLRPSGFVPEELETSTDVDGLSGGEKEQLHFAVRMALAHSLGGEERRLLILDDTLMATDGVRLPRILDILEEASERFQILILTCHPERFAGLTGASWIDLGEQLRGAAPLPA